MSMADRWLTLTEIAQKLGLSQRSVKLLRARRGLPLGRVSPHAQPGCFESEFNAWIRRQLPDGKPIRPARSDPT